MNPLILVIFYLIAGVLGLKFKRAAYILSTFTSVFTLIFLYSGLSVNSTEAYFIIISSLTWIFISLFSLGYDIEDGILASTFSFTTAMMLIILLAKDALTFLLGWEGMTVASFFSLYSHKNSRKGAYLFLAFGELSFILILTGFVLASSYAGTLTFALWTKHNWNFIFLLISIGFIIKMAAVPFHIWLPEAHSRAPANMSAQLSGVMTLMGLYGLIRFLQISIPSSFIGVILLIIGGISALIGVLYAAICDHIKRLPAYSTIENDGIIIALVGAFIITFHDNQHIVAAFMLMSALFFAFAHTTAKSLLFIVAGKLERSGGELLGGKYKLSRIGAISGALAAISLAGVPPLPGFVAEWTALESMFQSFYFSDLWLRVLTVSVGALIALTAGISTIAMSKFIVQGIERRDRKNHDVSDLGLSIGIAVLIILGFLPQLILRLTSPTVSSITGISTDKFIGGLLGIPPGFLIISGKGFGIVSPTILFILIVGLFLLVYFVMKLCMKKVRVVNAWSGGLNNEEYPSRGHSSILLLTQKWIFGTDKYLNYRDFILDFYQLWGSSVYKFSEFFQRVFMPGNDRRYVLYILIALFIYIGISTLF